MVKTNDQCYNYGDAQMNDTHFCFTLGVLPICAGKTKEYQQMTVIFTTEESEFEFTYQNYLNNDDLNCYELQPTEKARINAIIKETNLAISMSIEGIVYPL